MPSRKHAPMPAADPFPSDTSRRRLLKRAAQAAPLIATLPSGAVFAQASASQCLISDQEATANGIAPNVVEPPGGWLARPLEYRTFTESSTGNEYDYYIIPDGSDPPFYRVAKDNLDDQGSPESALPDTSGGDWTETTPDPDNPPSRNCLQLYVVDEDYTTIEDCPDGAERCVWPIEIRTTDVPPQGQGLTGLHQSCLCSFDPTFPAC